METIGRVPVRIREEFYKGPNPRDLRTHMDGCQNYGPFLGTLNNRCRIILGTQKGTIMLTTTHILRLLGPKTILYKTFGLF